MFQEVEWCEWCGLMEWATRRGSVALQIGEQPQVSPRAGLWRPLEALGKGCSLRERGIPGMDGPFWLFGVLVLDTRCWRDVSECFLLLLLGGWRFPSEWISNDGDETGELQWIGREEMKKKMKWKRDRDRDRDRDGGKGGVHEVCCTNCVCS